MSNETKGNTKLNEMAYCYCAYRKRQGKCALAKIIDLPKHKYLYFSIIKLKLVFISRQ